MALMRAEGSRRSLGRLEEKRADLRLDAVEKDGSFSGYASLFGVADLGRDVIEPGAFARSLEKRQARGIRMLFQHDPGQPIGAWEELREDGKGLFVRGRLATGVARAKEILDLMRAGALDGLSIGFRTVRARTDKAAGVRRILEADLWEISVVTFPMMPEARVERVKAARARPGPIGEFERWLVEGVGLSPADARTVAAKGFGHLVAGRRRASLAVSKLAAQLRRATLLINAKGQILHANPSRRAEI